MVESDNQMKEDGISQVFWLEGIEDNIKLHLQKRTIDYGVSSAASAQGPVVDTVMNL